MERCLVKSFRKSEKKKKSVNGYKTEKNVNILNFFMQQRIYLKL